MTKNLPASFFLLTVFFLLMDGCAKISTPSGGHKDRLPPVVVESSPENGAKNFVEKKISITFNEYVVLDNITDKFMVSPPMKKKPRVFIKGQGVNVEYDEALKDSTTYTLYFQDAIKDLNEGNILDNYQFVFSTGPVLDSLSVTGNVYNSFDLEAPEKTLVLMYQELADSAVVKHLPDYISRVDQNGYFRFNNVRAENYRLYALKDGDNSKNYNLIDEEFAFISTPVEITPEKNFIPIVIDTTLVKDTVTIKKGVGKVPEPVILKGEYQLFLFAAQKKAHYLTKSSRDIKYQMIYSLSLPPDSMKFDFSIPGAAEGAYFTERSRNNDTLKIWLVDSALYSQPQIKTIIKYPFTDTLGITGYKEDTVTMRFVTPRAPRVAKIKKPVLIVETNIASGAIRPGQSIVFKSQTPFIQPDTSQIQLYELLDTTRLKIPFHLAKDSTNSCKYFLISKLLQGKKYLFIADSASFSNLYNEHSDSIGIKFSVRNTNSYGKLTLKIHNYVGDRIIQLLSNKEKLIREVIMKKDGNLVFPLLESGFYRVRVIYDLNGDGKWTTGDFDSGRQPEPVSYYKSEIDIKTDWDLEQDWDIGIENFKDQKLRVTKKPK